MSALTQIKQLQDGTNLNLNDIAHKSHQFCCIYCFMLLLRSVRAASNSKKGNERIGYKIRLG